MASSIQFRVDYLQNCWPKTIFFLMADAEKKDLLGFFLANINIVNDSN